MIKLPQIILTKSNESDEKQKRPSSSMKNLMQKQMRKPNQKVQPSKNQLARKIHADLQEYAIK